MTITKTRPNVKLSTTSALPLEKVRKRNTYPMDCPKARATVR